MQIDAVQYSVVQCNANENARSDPNANVMTLLYYWCWYVEKKSKSQNRQIGQLPANA